MSGFLETSAASVLRSLSVFADISSGCAPASGEIAGILKTMDDEMKADSASATEAEEAASKSFKIRRLDAFLEGAESQKQL